MAQSITGKILIVSKIKIPIEETLFVFDEWKLLLNSDQITVFPPKGSFANLLNQDGKVVAGIITEPLLPSQNPRLHIMGVKLPKETKLGKAKYLEYNSPQRKP